MDEPTSAMDLSRESELINKLKTQLVNQTILLITHRTSILELATRVLVIDQGKIVAQGPKSDFMRGQQQQAAQEAAGVV
jgi:ATP-binding cassette subfamily C protein LapB